MTMEPATSSRILRLSEAIGDWGKVSDLMDTLEEEGSKETVHNFLSAMEEVKAMADQNIIDLENQIDVLRGREIERGTAATTAGTIETARQSTG